MIARVDDGAGTLLYDAPGADGELPRESLALIQEGLRGVVRLPGGTAHALSGRAFPIPVMGKTGTTSDFRDALFVGSTYGAGGITVAVRIGFDDNRSLGRSETGGRLAMPVFQEVMAQVYAAGLVGPAPVFPTLMEARITRYRRRARVSASVGRDGVAFCTSPAVTRRAGAPVRSETAKARRVP